MGLQRGRTSPSNLMRHAELIEAVKRANGTAPTHPALAAYVAKVKQHAYRVTDDDVAALKAAGLSEDEIFHATTDAALQAGLERLHKGLEVLDQLAGECGATLRATPGKAPGT